MVFRVPRDGVNLLGWISVKWRNISFFFLHFQEGGSVILR